MFKLKNNHLKKYALCYNGDQCPWESCQAWCLDEWSFSSGRTRYGRSSDRQAWALFSLWNDGNKNWTSLPMRVLIGPSLKRCNPVPGHTICGIASYITIATIFILNLSSWLDKQKELRGFTNNLLRTETELK